MDAYDRFSSEVQVRLAAADPKAASCDPLGTFERIALEVAAEWRDRQPLELVEVIDSMERLKPSLGSEWAALRDRLRQAND